MVDSTALTMRCWQETLQSFGFGFPLTTLQRHSGQDGHDMLHSLLPGPQISRVVPRILKAQGQRYRDNTCRVWWHFPRYERCSNG